MHVAVCGLAMVSAVGFGQKDVKQPPATVSGIEVGVFRQEIHTPYSTADGLPSDGACGVALTASGCVYAATSSGLARFEKGKWGAVRGLPAGPVRCVATHGEIVYAATDRVVYRIDGATINKFSETAPTPPTSLAASGQDVWMGTDTGLFRLAAGQVVADHELDALMKAEGQVRQVATGRGEQVAVASQAGLFLRRDDRWRQLLPRTKRYSWAVYDARGVAFDRAGRLWSCSPQGVGCLDGDTWRLFTGEQGLPYNDFTTAAAGEDGVVWFGTALGAIRYDGKRWAYRQGRRWLPNDQVRAIAVDEKGNAWFATPSGVGVIERRSMTLAEKARLFEERIDKRHRRTPYGFVLECQLERPGDLSSYSNHDSDNDGLWTGMYGASECFAYAATKDPAAKRRAKAAFEALKFLCDVTQGGEKIVMRGFPARSILPTSGPNPNEWEGYSAVADRNRQAGDPFWKVIHPRWPRSADGKWYWKCDTSSDELDGHYFFNALYYDLVAETDAEKARVRKVICDTTDHLIANGYGLVDWDGKRTRWAYFGPHDLNHSVECWEERGMNSLGILSYLAIAEHVSGDKKYARARRELIDKHSYALNALVSPKIHLGPGTGNQSDDEMTIMRFFALLRYETDPDVRALMQEAFWRYWLLVRRERNPFFNFLYAATYEPGSRSLWGHRFGPRGNWLQESVDALTGTPLDMVNWRLLNSHRLDILPHPEHRRGGDGRPTHGYLRDGDVLPIENRYIQHWSEDVWQLDQGGDGRTESDGAFWLLAYYTGKYFGFVKD